SCCSCLYFFCQAEDGIRDRNVTGVQTCALPIFGRQVLKSNAVYAAGDPNVVGLAGDFARSAVYGTVEGIEVAISDTATVNKGGTDRKSTRLNSSHVSISYAVFCLEKKR